VDRLSHGDGERYWLINRFPIPNEQGEPLFIGGIGVDISQRVRAEEALVEVQRQQQAILDNIPDLVWLKDAESRFITTNEAFAKACGVSVQDLAGKTDLDIWPRDLAKKYRRDDRYVMKSGRQKCTEELLADPAGNRIWIETFKMPIVNHRGEMAGTTGIARNVNGRKRAEEELLDYQGQLKSLAAALSLAEERERRRIATELHDQIGQYLAFTRMKLNLLEHSGLSTGVASPLEEIRNYIDLIIKRVRSLTCQISPPLLYEVGFEAAVEWLGESFQEEYGFQVVFWDDRRAKPLDEEIKVTLFQVVRELLMNVAKHALAKRVQISVEGDPTWIKITVEDDGAGFDMGKIMTSRDNRCGFGLFNIRQQMAYLGGEIAFETNNGSGTRVTLLAPLREATPESGSAAVLQES
jgi:PAS domain S-box-containing protein